VLQFKVFTTVLAGPVYEADRSEDSHSTRSLRTSPYQRLSAAYTSKGLGCQIFSCDVNWKYLDCGAYNLVAGYQHFEGT
jgi:hypothetical protein